MNTVIAPLHYTFENVEVYELNKDSSFYDALTIYMNGDSLREKLFLIQKKRRQDFIVNKDEVMFTECVSTNNTQHDFFFLERDEKNFFIAAYSWNKDYISMFPDFNEKKPFTSAYDAKDIHLPIVHHESAGSVAYGEVINYHKIVYQACVTTGGDKAYLENYYANYFLHLFDGVVIKEVKVSFKLNHTSVRSYHESTSYDMTVSVEFEVNKEDIPTVSLPEAVDEIIKESYDKLVFVKQVKDKNNRLLIFRKGDNKNYIVYKVSLNSIKIIEEIVGITSRLNDLENNFIGKIWTDKTK